MIKLLSRYSCTTNPKLKKEFPHIQIKGSEKIIFKLLTDYLKNNEYENIKSDEYYLDLYGEKDGYEVSFQIEKSEIENVLEIQISIFGKKKRGRTHIRLELIYDDILSLIVNKKQ
ncbi:MAG: hypothetical protein ACI31G_03780 [Bacilli bacterium]